MDLSRNLSSRQGKNEIAFHLPIQKLAYCSFQGLWSIMLKGARPLYHYPIWAPHAVPDMTHSKSSYSKTEKKNDLPREHHCHKQAWIIASGFTYLISCKCILAHLIVAISCFPLSSVFCHFTPLIHETTQ